MKKIEAIQESEALRNDTQFPNAFIAWVIEDIVELIEAYGAEDGDWPEELDVYVVHPTDTAALQELNGLSPEWALTRVLDGETGQKLMCFDANRYTMVYSLAGTNSELDRWVNRYAETTDATEGDLEDERD